jgi:hypothetical protein
MTPDRDVSSKPQSQVFPAEALSHAVQRREEAGPAAVFQEINERRARIENGELLRHLRGL